MVFPSFGSDVYMENIPRKRPPFFHSNSPPCCFCLDLLHRPLDETNRGVFSETHERIGLIMFFFRRREVIFL